MNWTTHTPKFDGDAPDGVTLNTHIVEIQNVYHGWDTIHHALEWITRAHGMPVAYRYMLRNPPATYKQVKAWHIASGLPLRPQLAEEGAKR